MQFKMIGAVAALVAAKHAVAALTAQDIMDSLDVITDYSMNATTALESATTSNHEDAIEVRVEHNGLPCLETQGEEGGR